MEINSKSEHYKYFQNYKCEYFPCHKVENEAEFNCLFCFCPLYLLKDHCGGNFKYTSGVKDCSDCTIPHTKGAYSHVMSKMDTILKIGRDRD